MFIVTGGALLLGHHFTNLRLTGKDRRTRSRDHRLHRRADHRIRSSGSINTRHIEIGSNDHRRTDTRHAPSGSSALFLPAVRARNRHRIHSLIHPSPRITPPNRCPIGIELGIGFAISFVASYIAINLFMWLIRRMGTLTLWPFAVFTAATGAIVLAVVYGG